MRALVVLAIALAACGGKEPDAPPGPPPHRAFYFWRTTFRLSPQERLALTQLHADRLYVRMFDVGWQSSGPAGEVELLGKLAPADSAPLPAGLEIVPVVYIKNDVFVHGAPHLADTVRRELAARAQLVGLTAPPREIQIDCDWTESTRDAYFAFLTALHAPGTALSATIRLHQVKYRERTGTPPVERGMLMFYNMGKFSPDPDARAIFDAEAAARYVGRMHDYPLALDVALPIWSWVVEIRDNLVVDLLQSTDPDELAGLDFLDRSAPDRYVATRTAFLHGVLLREGDVLKVEVTGPAETLAAAKMIESYLPPLHPGAPPRTVSLFDLSERNLNRHGIEKLENVFRAVR